MLEKIFPFAIAAFVLSQVSERLSNFLKLYLPKKLCGNLELRETDPEKEKIRERKIMALSLIAGALTTALFYFSYVIPTETGQNGAKWIGYMKENWFTSFLLMSLFLSFGSKFWHDLLDILFLYKNSQRLLSTGEANYADSPEEINKMLQQGTVAIARKALNDNREALMKTPGVVAVGLGSSAHEEPVLRVYFKDSLSAARMDPDLIWTDEFGVPRTIRIEKIVSGPAEAQAAIVGGKIFNKGNPALTGTMGFVFKEKYADVFYISSCYSRRKVVLTGMLMPVQHREALEVMAHEGAQFCFIVLDLGHEI